MNKSYFLFLLLSFPFFLLLSPPVWLHLSVTKSNPSPEKELFDQYFPPHSPEEFGTNTFLFSCEFHSKPLSEGQFSFFPPNSLLFLVPVSLPVFDAFPLSENYGTVTIFTFYWIGHLDQVESIMTFITKWCKDVRKEEFGPNFPVLFIFHCLILLISFEICRTHRILWPCHLIFLQENHMVHHKMANF